MRPFNLLLVDLNAGQTNATLSAHMEELLQAVKKHGRPGTLTVKLKVAPAGKGQADVDKVLVACESQISLPKPEQPTDFFWMTDDAELSRKHPKQRELQLQDVSSHGATNAPLTAAATAAVAAAEPSSFTPATPVAALVQAVANGAPTTFTPPDDDGVIQPLA
ncbi:hypothetical protein [Pseudorhodoferax sp. Leaf274]|uniref:hypothetical protein n=1 Tax=Pseudorhodoferax sp. Leaf274 TaxID=1736318 RepID=UPI0007037493|nr:hypothetical protein [Pseudorhodoferax sp. Leaf274]KQP37578.1 hypothetical protein ASF44_14645 [Pseudorhodoferax sp. Leaf274]